MSMDKATCGRAQATAVSMVEDGCPIDVIDEQPTPVDRETHILWQLPEGCHSLASLFALAGRRSHDVAPLTQRAMTSNTAKSAMRRPDTSCSVGGGASGPAATC